MATDIFQLRVITPAGLAVEDRTSSVTLTMRDGEIGILPEHVGYTGLLGTGILSFTSADGGELRRFMISEGFATFEGGVLTLLADFVVTPEQVNQESYDSERANLQKAVGQLNSFDPEWSHAKGQLSRIEAIDHLLAKH